MPTIRINSTSLALLVAAALLLAGPRAWAQGRGGAQQLNWPHTFTGQPDFAFTRDEAVVEATTRAARENTPMPLIPSIKQLVEDDATLDPMGLTRPQPVSATEAVSATEDVSDTQGASTNAGTTLLDKLMANAVSLPEIHISQTTDVTEFKANLITVISGTIAAYQPQPGSLSYGGAIRSLVLQGIVTSPQKYTVINNRRYQEGDAFKLRMTVPVPQLEVQSAVKAQLPPEGTLGDEQMKAYQAATADVLSAYAKGCAASPAACGKVVNVPVEVRQIRSREVVLDVAGRTYNLDMPYAY